MPDRMPIYEAVEKVRESLFEALEVERADVEKSSTRSSGDRRRSAPGAALRYSSHEDTLEERRASIANEHLGLIGRLDGFSFDELPREGMFKLLEDPLSSSTRATRRNLLVAASVGLFVGVFGVVPHKLPGVEAEIGRFPFLASLLAILVYESVAFYLYVLGDQHRLRIAQRETSGTLSRFKRMTREIEEWMPVFKRSAVPQLEPLAAKVLAEAKVELATLVEEWSAVILRRIVDFWAPFAVALVAAALVVCRLLGSCDWIGLPRCLAP